MDIRLYLVNKHLNKFASHESFNIVLMPLPLPVPLPILCGTTDDTTVSCDNLSTLQVSGVSREFCVKSPSFQFGFSLNIIILTPTVLLQAIVSVRSLILKTSAAVDMVRLRLIA